tara:strand:+ start:304 stop:552 length:249 start_codon:yes stop_codon:yes gene_type:complete
MTSLKRKSPSTDNQEKVKELVEDNNKLRIEISNLYKLIDKKRQKIRSNDEVTLKMCKHEWVIDRDCYDHKTTRYCIHCQYNY